MFLIVTGYEKLTDCDMFMKNTEEEILFLIVTFLRLTTPPGTVSKKMYPVFMKWLMVVLTKFNAIVEFEV